LVAVPRARIGTCVGLKRQRADRHLRKQEIEVAPVCRPAHAAPEGKCFIDATELEEAPGGNRGERAGQRAELVRSLPFADRPLALADTLVVERQLEASVPLVWREPGGRFMKLDRRGRRDAIDDVAGDVLARRVIALGRLAYRRNEPGNVAAHEQRLAL